MKKYSNKNRGFSMIELVITLGIGAILMAYGIPAYHDFSARQKMTNDINDWVSDMTLARVTAVKLGQRVAIQSIGTWKGGWQVFQDVDGDGAYDAAIDNLIREGDRVEGDMVMDSAGNSIIVFDNLGSLVGGGTFQMLFSHPDVPDDISASVSPSGLIATQKL